MATRHLSSIPKCNISGQMIFFFLLGTPNYIKYHENYIVYVLYEDTLGGSSYFRSLSHQCNSIGIISGFILSNFICKSKKSHP